MKRCIKCNESKELIEFHKNCKAKDGHHSYCKSCNAEAAKLLAKKNKDKINAKRRERRKLDSNYRDKISIMKKEAYWKNREAHLLMQAKQAFRKRGISCDLKVEDIIIPKLCPIFQIPFDRGRFSPSLDRIDNTKPYTKDNIWIISRLANTIKNDGTIKELITFCTNLPKYIKKYDIV